MCELTARHGWGTAWARHAMCELTARHGMATAWARHAMCESALRALCAVDVAARPGALKYVGTTVTYRMFHELRVLL